MTSYERATVYFATGTGNSYRVAVWFHQACQQRHIPSSLIPVNLAKPGSELIASSGQLLALAFPTHGGLPPWSVLKFLFRLPRRRAARFLCLPTRGSFFVGPLLVPGAAVLASFVPSLILLGKGFRPKGAVSVDMPMNTTAFHPPYSAQHTARILVRASHKSQRYFTRFSSRDSLWLTPNNLYEFVWSLVILYYVPLFPILYVLVARFTMGKLMFATNRCRGCGTCVTSCPTRSLTMKGTAPKRPYWGHTCDFCLRCLNFCPHHAIELCHSWAVLIWYIAVSLAAGGLVFGWLQGFLPWLRPYHNFWTEELFDALFYYPIFLGGYFLFYHASRLTPVNAFFSYTSWSRFLSQYREPGTSLRQLMATRYDDCRRENPESSAGSTSQNIQ